MKKKEKIIQSFELELRDIETIKQCLNYCYHRIKKHGKFFEFLFEDIQRLRKEFGIIKDKDKNYKFENSTYCKCNDFNTVDLIDVIELAQKKFLEKNNLV